MAADMKVNGGESNAAFLRWFAPLLQALKDLGGSATPADVQNKIAENEHLTEEELNETRGRNNSNRFSNEVAWARNYLVYGGYIDKSVRGVWTLTEAGKTVKMTHSLASDIFRNAIRGNTEKNTLGDADVDTVHYWLYAPGRGAGMWDDYYADGIMGIGWPRMGNLTKYEDKEEMRLKLQKVYESDSSQKNSALALWQFTHEIKPGDIVFAKKGTTQIIGRGIVESGYEYDKNADGGYVHIRRVKWTHKGSWKSNEKFAQKTLTDVTDYTQFVKKTCEFFEGENPEEESTSVDYPVYTKVDFLKDVYINEEGYDTLTGLLKSEKNIILQGAPGVGKTFIAKRLAYSVMGVKDIERVVMIQFHQSYSYEDFIMGFRPSESGFELRKGAFYDFCKLAEDDSENDYFFIIDEINRGNLSKIFGELFMLIENDKRGSKNKLRLLYSDEMFYVPENVYIIGTMNTADRSLAMLDYALRRRFAFFEMKPAFDSDGFKEYQSELESDKFNRLISSVKNLNEAISGDESLGEGFCIGHSYFCNLSPFELTDEKLLEIIDYKLIPLLKEYWFDEPQKVRDFSDKLREAIK